MPNQVHGIIWINEDGNIDAERRSAPTKTIVHPGSSGATIRAYKSAVIYAATGLQHQRGAVLWQRNYCEHVNRNDKDLKATRHYILSNPLTGETDDENIELYWQTVVRACEGE